MAKTKISEFSTTAGNNTDINSINIAEGCAPSGINDAIRELMRQLKEFQTGGAGDSVNSGGDFSVATNKFTVAAASGNTAVAGTLAVTGVATLTAQPILSSLTASKAVFTDASKGLVSNDVTGTGNVVMSNSPTLVTPALGTPSSGVVTNLTGTASININGTVGATTPSTGAFTTLSSTGNTTLGDADTDTLTFNASFVTGTTLKSAKLDTNTLALAAYDVDGTAYTNLVTLTAGNSPTLALTSTGVGTINNMSIGATTASTGAFTTLSASGNVTLSGGTANGVLYLNGSKVATAGTALVFDGTNLGLGVTPSAWGGSYAALQIKGGVSLTAYPLLNTTGFLNTNAYFDGTNWKYISSSYATRYKIQNNDGAHSWDIAASGTAGNAITFTQAMTLDASGNLGIGTTSPARRLVVQATDSTTNTKYIVSQFNRASSGTAAAGVGGQIQFQAQDDAGTQREAAIIGWDLSDVSAASPKGRLFLGSRGVNDAVVIDNSGNLGLGVTPSAWNNSIKALQVNNAALASFTNGGNVQTWLANNAYYDNATGWLYKNSSVGAALYAQNFNGSHNWNIAPSGTAGNAITFTQAMTLDASGNLAIGTTSTESGVRLWVGNSAAQFNWAKVSNSLNSLYAGVRDTGEVGISSSGAYPMLFYTNGSERARIDSGGYFRASNTGTYLSGNYHELYQTATDERTLVANSSNATTPLGILVNYSGASPNDTGKVFLECRDSGPTTRASIRSNGGLANYSANDVNLSDRREKTNFAPAGEYLSKICAIPVQTFNYIDQNLEQDAGLTLGVVAQDVQAVAPELVMESNWGTEEEPKMRLSIYQTDLQYALMKCIQEQQAQIESLRKRLADAGIA